MTGRRAAAARGMRAGLAAACMALLPAAALPQDGALTGLIPEGAYGTALAAALADPAGIDFAALRRLYAADPAYTGRSRLADRDMAAFLARQSGEPAPDWTEDDVLGAVMADFPLLDTHVAAFGHYKTSALPNRESLMGAHAGFYQDILKAVLATERQTDGMRTFTVLSIGEQRSVIEALGLDRGGTQALVDIDGVPHDRIDTAKGPILFDISAFFGR